MTVSTASTNRLYSFLNDAPPKSCTQLCKKMGCKTQRNKTTFQAKNKIESESNLFIRLVYVLTITECNICSSGCQELQTPPPADFLSIEKFWAEPNLISRIRFSQIPNETFDFQIPVRHRATSLERLAHVIAHFKTNDGNVVCETKNFAYLNDKLHYKITKSHKIQEERQR